MMRRGAHLLAVVGILLALLPLGGGLAAQEQWRYWQERAQAYALAGTAPPAPPLEPCRISYNYCGQVASLQFYSEGDRGVLRRCERFAWQAMPRQPRPLLSAVTVEDGDGATLLALDFDYDSAGRCLGERLCGATVGELTSTYYYYDGKGRLWQRRHSDGSYCRFLYEDDAARPCALLWGVNQDIEGRLSLRYDGAGRLTALIADDGSALDMNDSGAVRQRVVCMLSWTGKGADAPVVALQSQTAAETTALRCEGSWHEVVDTMKRGLHNFIDNCGSLLEQCRRRASFWNNVKDDVDHILETSLGPYFLQFAGHCRQPMECGVYGKGELSDKVRVTTINGIVTTRADLVVNLKLLSSCHGEVNIHYIFRPTEGWTRDFYRAFLTQLGYVSPYAKQLAALWRELIDEMGGTGGGGLIIHYAHSLGGTDTHVATTLLSPAERRMLRIITIGSATMIPDEGFESAVNYVSRNDSVSWLVDPLGFLRGLFTSSGNIVYIGDNDAYPFIDHLLASGSYRELLETLGGKFLEMVGK